MSDRPASSSSSSQAPPSTSKRKKPSDKDLDLNNANRGVWLVKVPKYISDRWESSTDGAELGQLRIARRAGQKPNVAFTLSEGVARAKAEEGKEANGGAKTKNGGGSQKQIPREHKFVVQSVAAQTLAVFSHTAGANQAKTEDGQQPLLGPGQDRLALEGRVVQRAECRPVSDGVYMSLKKEAIMRAIEPARQTMQLERAVASYKPRSNHVANIEYEARRKAEGKKSREEREVVMERLFALFEKHQYYNIRDLVRETNQPVSYLKEVLKEVCNYNLKNPHKNMWELKPEYRHYHKPEEKKDGQGDRDSSDDD